VESDSATDRGEMRGPYYYAYYKEDNKLKKKYIATYLPKDKDHW
jgi:hypothetical protein